MALATAIAAAATIGGAVLGSKSQNKAADKALAASNYAADQSAAVLRENYDKSAQALAPWQNSGLAANNQINALLGLSVPQAQPGQMAGDWNAYLQQNPDVMQGFQQTGQAFGSPQEYAKWHYQNYGQNEGRQFPGQQTGTQGTTTDAARAAFDQFRNSTGYQFRLGQGMDAVNSGYAGAGTLKSGAALKAINEYGQNFASNEFGNYMGMLGNQQGIGFNAASAQAGVSQNMGNSLANIAMNKGENAANAALSKTNGLANGLSLLGGGLFKIGG